MNPIDPNKNDEAPDNLALAGDEYWKQVLASADQQSERELKAYEKYVRLYKDGTFGKEADGPGRATSSPNQSFATLNIMMSFLLAQAPSIEVEARDNNSEEFAIAVQLGLFPTTEEATTQFADSLEQHLDYAYEMGDMQRMNNAALFECLARGLGISKVSYCDELKHERVDTLRRHEVYFDPHARFSINQCQYVIHHCEYPIAEAKKYFENMGVNADAIKANYQLSNNESIQGEHAEKVESKHKDVYKFHEVWIKSGSERILEYREYETRKLIARRPWPFVIPNGGFPFALLMFHTQFSHLSDPFSHMHVVEGMRQQYEDMVNFAGRQARRSIAKKIAYDKKLLSPEEAEKILDAKDMALIAVDRLSGKNINEVIQVLDFNSGNDTSLQAAATAKNIIDEITGLSEFERGAAATKRMSAQEAAIRDQNARLRVDRLQRLLDAYLTEQTRLRALVAYQLVAPETIAKTAGPKSVILWQLAKSDPEALLEQYAITIQAGSTGEMETQRRISRMKDFFQIAMTINGLPSGPRYDPVIIANEILKLNKVRRPERYMFTNPPQMMPPPGPPQGQPGQVQLPHLTEEGEPPPPPEQQQGQGEAA